MTTCTGLTLCVCVCVCVSIHRPVSLLSVFGGTTFSFNPFQLVSAQVIASDYTLDDAVTKETAKRW